MKGTYSILNPIKNLKAIASRPTPLEGSVAAVLVLSKPSDPPGVAREKEQRFDVSTRGFLGRSLRQ